MIKSKNKGMPKKESKKMKVKKDTDLPKRRESREKEKGVVLHQKRRL